MFRNVLCVIRFTERIHPMDYIRVFDLSVNVLIVQPLTPLSVYYICIEMFVSTYRFFIQCHYSWWPMYCMQWNYCVIQLDMFYSMFVRRQGMSSSFSELLCSDARPAFHCRRHLRGRVFLWIDACSPPPCHDNCICIATCLMMTFCHSWRICVFMLLVYVLRVACCI